MRSRPWSPLRPGRRSSSRCTDASGGQLSAKSTVADVATLDFARVNPVTGPVFVDGAAPGDALKVTIDEFKPSGFGWTANIPGFGLLADQFPEPALYLWSYDKVAMSPAAFSPKGQVPLKPFAGTIGVALAEPGLHSVVPPRRVGGNLDIRDLAAGTRPLSSGRGRRRALLGRRHPRGAGRRRGLRHGDRKPDERRPHFDVVHERQPEDAALHHAGPGRPPSRRQGLRGDDGDRPRPHGGGAGGGRQHDRPPHRPLRPRSRSRPTCSPRSAADLRISEIVDQPNWVVSFYFPRLVLE